MSTKVSGFDFWELVFDAKGQPVGGTKELVDELPKTGATDLFVFSHGWNNDRPRALRLYERFFGEVGKLLDDGQKVATAGVVWPSMRWVDETDPEGEADEGGAVDLAEDRLSDRELVTALSDVFPGQDDVLEELGALLEDRPQDEDELARFQALMKQLTTAPDNQADEEDNQELALVTQPPEEAFASGARVGRRRGGGQGGAGFEDIGGTMDVGGEAGINFGRMWENAKQALRQTTYWEMKKRAGDVGLGLGRLFRKLHETDGDLRIHLIGHSFGARVVSFSLLGLGDDPPDPSPVKSVFLVQGAFSHYAFADKLPHDTARSGWLHGMQERVDGPLVVTHSVHDTAVGRAYPVASLAAGQDAAGIEEWMQRWGAMGHSGALEVSAVDEDLGVPGTEYPFKKSKFLNLDGDDVITEGKPPSGAHSDIFHPHLAWVALRAAGLKGRVPA